MLQYFSWNYQQIFVHFSDISNKLWRRLESLEIYFVDVIGYSFEKNDVSKREDGVDIKIKFILKDKETTSLTYSTLESYHIQAQRDTDKVVSINDFEFYSAII